MVLRLIIIVECQIFFDIFEHGVFLDMMYYVMNDTFLVAFEVAYNISFHLISLSTNSFNNYLENV